MFAPFVSFSVCLQDNRKTASPVLMKLGGMVWHGIGTRLLHFGVDLIHRADTQIILFFSSTLRDRTFNVGGINATHVQIQQMVASCRNMMASSQSTLTGISYSLGQFTRVACPASYRKQPEWITQGHQFNRRSLSCEAGVVGDCYMWERK